jgi:hypothetical protein
MYLYLVDFITSTSINLPPPPNQGYQIPCLLSSCAHSLCYLEETSFLYLEYSVKILAFMKPTGTKWNQRNMIQYAQCRVLFLIFE